MNMRQKHRSPVRTRTNTIRYARIHPVKETFFEALVHHGTNIVHRTSIEHHHTRGFGGEPSTGPLHCTLDREDAIHWAWSSIRRDRHLVSDPCGEDLWPLPMVATFVLTANRALLVHGWDRDLPRSLAHHLGVPVPECDDLDTAVGLLGEPLRRNGVEAIACLSPGKPGSNEVVVYRHASLTLLGCRTLTELRRR